MATTKDKVPFKWEFAPDNNRIYVYVPDGYTEGVNKDIDQASPYSFKLTRYKDSETKKEWLKIECMLDNEPNGTVVATLTDLGARLRDFMEYGLAFKSIVYADLQKTIEINYLNINTTKKMEVDDALFKQACQVIAEAVTEYADAKTNSDEVHIPVVAFDLWLQDNGIEEYNIRLVKSKLKDKQIIKTVKNRYTNLVRLNKSDTPVRVMTIIKSKLDNPVKKTASAATASAGATS